MLACPEQINHPNLTVVMKVIPQIDTSDGSRQEIYSLPVETDYLEELLRYVFTIHWQSIVFGPIIEGGAYEFRCPNQPRGTVKLR